MKKELYIVLSIVILLSCGDKCHEPGEEVHEKYNSIFYIYNSTGFSLYSSQTHQSACDSAGKYCPDSLRLFDWNYSNLPINYSAGPNSSTGNYYFYDLPIYNESADNLAKSQVISKKFYLRLNYLDMDTIEIKYSLEYNSKCKYSYFKNQEVFYNEIPVSINTGMEKFDFIKQ